MSNPTPTQWWHDLTATDRLAYAHAILAGELSPELWGKVHAAGIATTAWDRTSPQPERYLPVPVRRLILDWVREAA